VRRVIETRFGPMDHVRTLRPTPEIYALYDGRVEGYRFSEASNWVDEGALSLGICSYAIVDGDEALIYDTHVSVEHARYVRRTLEREGVTRFTVLLSHWHLDHVAGTAAFADCEILAGRETAELLTRHRRAIQAGTHRGPPAIDPLVPPTRVLSGRSTFAIGRLEVELIPVNIHSRDATVVWLPERRVLLAGDTMEDTVTFVAEPEQLRAHGADLERLAALRPERILPNHGDPDVIAAGGYSDGLIRATRQYIDSLLREPDAREGELRELMAEALEAGWITYFAPYEAVHRHNLRRVADAR
jgi:cyclase